MLQVCFRISPSHFTGFQFMIKLDCLRLQTVDLGIHDLKLSPCHVDVLMSIL